MDCGFIARSPPTLSYSHPATSMTSRESLGRLPPEAQPATLPTPITVSFALSSWPVSASSHGHQRPPDDRATLHLPRAIFADEPTGLLDRHTGPQVLTLLRSYCQQGSLAAITHDPDVFTTSEPLVSMRDRRNADPRIAHLADLHIRQVANLHIRQVADVPGPSLRYTENGVAFCFQWSH